MPALRSPATRLAGALALLVLALCACSNAQAPNNREPHQGSATASPVGGVQQITVRAGDDLRFTPSTITVRPGRVRVVLVNDGAGAPHNWQLPKFPADFVPEAEHGQSTQATFTAPAPGSYEFVCTIHERQGQIGKLVVLPR